MAEVVVTCEVVIEVKIGGYRIDDTFGEIAKSARDKAQKKIDDALASFGRPQIVRQIGLPKPVAMRADWCLDDTLELTRRTVSETEPPP